MDHCQLCLNKIHLPPNYRGSTSQTHEQNVEAGVGMQTRVVLALRLLNMGTRGTLKEQRAKAEPTLGDQAWGSDQMDQWVQEGEAESAGL